MGAGGATLAGLTRALRFGVAAAVIVALLVLPGEASATNGYFKNSAIATAAEKSANGAYGGWCYAFVRDALRSASGGRIDVHAGISGYNPGFRNAGGSKVTAAQG